MRKDDFLQSSANTRVKEKRLLDKTQVERLIESDSLEDALKLLQDSVYQPFIQKLDRPEDYEKALSEELQNAYKEMYSITPERKLVDLLTLKYDYHNLKVLLKEYFMKSNFDEMISPITMLDIKQLRIDITNDRKLANIHIQQAIQDVKEYFEEDKDPQIIDIICDREYFGELKEKTKDLSSEFFEQYVKDLIDLTNVRTLIRCKMQNRSQEFIEKVLIEGGRIEKSTFKNYLFSEIDENTAFISQSNVGSKLKEAIMSYNETNSLEGFEKAMDDYLMSSLKETKRITYGPEILFGYLMAKEYEVKNLRIIFVSKLNNLSSDFIRERLRDSYV